MHFLDDPGFAWQEEHIVGWTARYLGRAASVLHLVRRLAAGLDPASAEFAAQAEAQPGCFALVAEAPGQLVAVADKVRGYPLFYAGKGTALRVSSSARLLAREFGLSAVNPDADLELRMAGYVTGQDTYLVGLSQLRAGELLCLRLGKEVPRLARYYIFHQAGVRSESEAALMEEFDGVTDAGVLRAMEEAGGRTIWVPLSGGLDSRLVLCKLRQHSYDHVRAYSYGTPGNHDARIAGEVAERLGVPWDFLPTTPEQARTFFLSEERRRYWEFADGLCTVPNLHGMFALRELVQRGDMLPGDMILNGQSGDFIAGQHIPDFPKKAEPVEVLQAAILNKHFNLRGHLLRDSAVVARIRQRIDAVLGDLARPDTEQACAKAYESWEWQERQSKRVINGQRNYDFFGLRWGLPLWELEQLHFWQGLPLEHKRGRKLFVRYVEAFDFFGLFRGYKPTLSRWPTGRGAILWVGRVLRAGLGLNASRAWYRRMESLSQYQYLYACVKQDSFLRHWADYKGPLAYFTDEWLAENGPQKAEL